MLRRVAGPLGARARPGPDALPQHPGRAARAGSGAAPAQLADRLLHRPQGSARDRPARVRRATGSPPSTTRTSIPARTSRPPTGRTPSSTASPPIRTRCTWWSRCWKAASRTRPPSSGIPPPAISSPPSSRRPDRPVSDSEALFAAAQRLMPGGVNSPVRAFRGVGGDPFFVARAEGARAHRRGRQRVHRLPRLVGPADPGARRRAGGRGGERGGCARGTSYGAPDRGARSSWPS